MGKLKLRNNHQGFGAIEIIMLIIMVVLIGVVGYMAYENHHKTTTTSMVTNSNIKNTSTPSKTTTTPSGSVVTYSSWGSTPNDVQNAVLVAWDNAAPGYQTSNTIDCNKNSPISGVSTDNPIYTENDKFVIAKAGCDGGTINLIVMSNSKWKYVSGTQFQLNCDDLTNNNVPTNLVVAAFKASAAGSPVQCSLGNTSKNLN